MPPQDKPVPLDENKEKHVDYADSSDNLSGGVNWDKDKVGRAISDNIPAGIQLAFNDAEPHRRPSPFGPVEQKPEPVKPAEPARPFEVAKPGDPVKVPEPAFARELPPGAIDSTQRAFQALMTVKAGQPLSPEQRKAFDDALKDAAKIEPKWAQETEKKLVEEIQSKERKLPDGTTLPPWTVEKEKQFFEKMAATQKAMAAMSPESQKKVSELDTFMSRLGPSDPRRGVFQRMLADEATKDPKMMDYLLQKNQLDNFTKDNAAGLVRRAMHQQEMSLLHARSVTSGIYAIALDKAGQPADQKQLETLLRDSISDRFAPANIPELVGLVEKHKLEEKDNKVLEDKIPGRSDLRKALEIINDSKQGSAQERLEKARPFFEKAIGAADLNDQKKVNEEIEKVSKERNALGDNIAPDKLNELESKAVELVEKARMPFEARMKYAQALQSLGVEQKDQKLVDKAIALYRAAEKIDPAYQFNPTLQGALLLAQKEPPEKFDEKRADELGKAEVDNRKAELVKQGKLPDDRPGWLKALTVAGETFAAALAFHLIGKYIFGPIGTAKNYLRRSWEQSSRTKNVDIETTPSLKPGEEPRLIYKNKDGKEMPVEGVRKADGRLRVWNGEKTELVKPGRGDKLYMAVPPDSSLTSEQLRDLAAKKLTPVGDENIINENRDRYKEEIERRDREIEELKKAQEELQKKNGGDRPPAEAPKPADAGSKALDIAKDLRAEQSGLNLNTREQVKQLLKSSLDKIDELKGSDRWSEADRHAFEKLIDDYARGDAEAIRRVHGHLGLNFPSSGPGAEIPGSGTRAEAHTDELSSLKELERRMEAPDLRARTVAQFLDKGPIRGTLEAAGMSKAKAEELEKSLLSEKKEERERAQKEIELHYERAGRGGIKGFAKEFGGRAGALVVVAALILPAIFAQKSSLEDGSSATWSGGKR